VHQAALVSSLESAAGLANDSNRAFDRQPRLDVRISFFQRHARSSAFTRKGLISPSTSSSPYQKFDNCSDGSRSKNVAFFVKQLKP